MITPLLEMTVVCKEHQPLATLAIKELNGKPIAILLCSVCHIVYWQHLKESGPHGD